MAAVVGRRVLLLFVAALMAVMMSMGPALANGGGAGGAGGQHVKNNKVYVCHNWNTLYVGKKLARYYVNNYKYDYYGPCQVYYWR